MSLPVTNDLSIFSFPFLSVDHSIHQVRPQKAEGQREDGRPGSECKYICVCVFVCAAWRRETPILLEVLAAAVSLGMTLLTHCLFAAKSSMHGCIQENAGGLNCSFWGNLLETPYFHMLILCRSAGTFHINPNLIQTTSGKQNSVL